ncbi:MAG: malto-oligosyltrehalose synthase, partial [Lapillicoccus sp.]
LLPDHPVDSVERAVMALLVAMDRYRAYVTPGVAADEEAVGVVARAADRARADLPEADHLALAAVVDAVLGRRGVDGASSLADVVVRFQQTCGPVMAKGIEDTAFYRWQLLIGLNEVGADPEHFSVTPDELFTFVERTALAWPTTMTTLSTHDTKRSEDVRARLAALSERPYEWQVWVRRAQELARPVRSEELDGTTEYLLWQTVVGAWPIDRERLQANAQKAIREAKVRTAWTSVDEGYEAAVTRFVDGIIDDPQVGAHIESWLADTADLVRATTLGQKLLQLMLPGVPDVYQGTELVDLSLVDPDNRRDVDIADRRARLARLDAGAAPVDLSDEKLLVTSRALRLRRDHPGWFVDESATWGSVASTSPHAVAVGRGDERGHRVVAVATRLVGSFAGWDGAVAHVPPGSWHDTLTGRDLTVTDGGLALADLLSDLPVALLVTNDA